MLKGKELVQKVRAKVLERMDVVVAGGGTAGIVAAIAAARGGVKTMLVEKRGFLGGMLTEGNAGITMFQKFSGSPEGHAKDLEALKANPDEVHVAKGIPMEIAKRLLRDGLAVGNDGTVGAYLFTESEDFKRVLAEMAEEAGVRIRLHTQLTDVVKDGDTVRGVLLESKSGREVVPATVFVDCTGDGDLCVRAGAEFAVGVTKEDYNSPPERIGQMQNMGVMFKAANVDFDKVFAYLKEHPECFQKQPYARFTYEEAYARYKKGEMSTFDMVRKGKFPNWFQVYVLPHGIATFCPPYVRGKDGCDADQLSAAESELSKTIDRWMQGLRDIPGFENMYLMQVPEMGVRETRHIRGDYLLGLIDIFKSRKFPDCIGFGAHPVDTNPRPKWLNNPETDYPPRWQFEIPYRILVVRGLANVLVAGRCVSATHEAIGSLRPTVQCMVMGEAAGTAAALAAKKGVTPRELDYGELRGTLKKNGVLC